MSLAPISTSQSGWASVAARRQPPAQPAPDLPTEPVQSATDLNRELEAQKESTLAYQLIKQLLIEQHSSESQSISIDTDDIDLNLSQTRSSSLSFALDESGLSFSWTQTEAFAATITGDGFSISIAGVRVQSFQLELEREVTQSDPLQIDLSGDGFETTGLSWSVRFDITGDGVQEDVSVASDDDAVLALDRNQNGRIDSGKEMFGEQNGHANGYAQLRRYDDNRDGIIDASDSIFTALKLLRWQADGSQQLQTLSEAGIASLSLQERQMNQASTAQGDAISTGSTVKFSDGRERQMADLWYRYWAAS